ncbi:MULTISPECIES: hypothetical protein [unclassified Rathayibacter]|uniref:hypothetical protein n=1 Tax=unclassified Rathayibacter TaxID=2609250 RepID=UPI000CE83C2B|nr:MULTISPECIES: hypothetical protein [unclassified Rathayibacter]PPF28424.1 hypothetical protein C5C54_06840 [Rathayibacter sp. AY1F2]PPH48366.1 hypothetical protein C5C42_02055 [Rathayibacter sp. AY1F7]
MEPEWIASLRGEVLAFTGKVLVDGEWTVREECVLMAERRGALGWKTDMSSKVTLLVYGDLASSVVTDKTRHYSKKLALAERLRRAGMRIHVIDGPGFSDLCAGFPARNRLLLPESDDEYLVLPQVGEGILGGPLTLGPTPDHSGVMVELDLAALDKGTIAHQRTLAAFIDVLGRRQLVAERPSRTAPRFDVGWSDSTRSFIAEVKSLGGPDEAQQIRLGMGQVVDYAAQLRRATTTDQEIQPVLVLERKPVDPRRWVDATRSAGVRLTWGPDFEWAR